jgi:hypothetical protein
MSAVRLVLANNNQTLPVATFRLAASATGNAIEVQNSGGSVLARIAADGRVVSQACAFGDSLAMINGVWNTQVWNGAAIGWVTGTSASTGEIDTGFRRNAAGVVEVNNGTAGTFRDLIVRNLRMSAPTLVPASASAAGNEGQIAWDADYIYICTATNTWKRVAIATW